MTCYKHYVSTELNTSIATKNIWHQKIQTIVRKKWDFESYLIQILVVREEEAHLIENWSFKPVCIVHSGLLFRG